MAAKALVPVEALPRHLPLSGPWVPPTGVVDAPPEVELATLSAGAAHGRLSGLTARGGLAAWSYQQGEGPLYIPRGCTTDHWKWATVV